MRKRLCLVPALLAGIWAWAQPVAIRDGFSPRLSVVTMSEPVNGFDPQIRQVSSLVPDVSGKYHFNKIQSNQARADYDRNARPVLNKKAGTIPQPFPLNGYEGNYNTGVPNDNSVAVGNDGTILSAVNSNVRIFNAQGQMVRNRSLANLAASLGSLNRTYDPKVIFDPETERFILVFLNGSESNDTRIVVCFSQTSSPDGAWNVYALPGNPFSDTTWTDYPIIGINEKELFITVNLLKDNKGWKDGFVQSVIWQVDKKEGFEGGTLQHRLWSGINHGGKNLWSICPVLRSEAGGGPNQYFLTVRPADLSNDTVFITEITNTRASGMATLNTRVFKTGHSYGIPPTVPQPNGQWLETNDARVLSAIQHLDMIQYVQTTRNPMNQRSAVRLGQIRNPEAASPVFNGYYISRDTMDFAYPSIAWAGTYGGDQSMFITFSHVSAKWHPGTAAVITDGNGGFSDPVWLKQGVGGVNQLLDSAERWGDYTGIQRKYNDAGTVWISNSFANRGEYGTWIAGVQNWNAYTGKPESGAEAAATQLSVYPVPAVAATTIRFSQPQGGMVKAWVVDMQGRQTLVFEDRVGGGTAELQIRTDHLAAGKYTLVVQTADLQKKQVAFAVANH